MILGFGFLTPWLLLGAAAMAIPFVLHLMSNVRAKSIQFPTLRFLKMSMEKTARRRRVQHWLLLLLRAALLGLLAIAVAEPITQALGGWMGKNSHAVAVVLDNSCSMAAKSGGVTRLEQARKQAGELLTGENPPEKGAVLATNGPSPAGEITSDWAALGRTAANTPQSGGRAPLLQKIRQAAKLLDKPEIVAQKSIYVFSDLQKASFEEIASAKKLIDQEDIHVMIVNTASRGRGNVAITKVEIGGRRIVNSSIKAVATIVNSSPGDREVNAGLKLNGELKGAPRRIMLAGAGKDRSVATVRFLIASGSTPGAKIAEVFLCDENTQPFKDDLELDNRRQFCLTVGPRARALILRGKTAENASPADDASTQLKIATDPWNGRADKPWSITQKLMNAADFQPQDLAETDALLIANVASFTPGQAAAISDFVSRGGTVMIFLGPDTDPDAYNKAFGTTFLPGKLLQPVGQIGPDAEAAGVTSVDVSHPYLKGLFKERDDYLSPLARRYFRLDRSGRGSTVLMGLSNRDPLILTKKIGRGRITLCATAASGQWSNFPGSGANVIVPMIVRACLQAPQSRQTADSYDWGAQVPIRPKTTKRGSITVTAPGKSETFTLKLNPRGQATFTNTRSLGVYHWRIDGPDAGKPGNSGSFAINPNGAECDLNQYANEDFRRALTRAEMKNVYVGATLKEVTAFAVADAQPTEWWDLVCVAVILLLIVEALVANRDSNA